MSEGEVAKRAWKDKEIMLLARPSLRGYPSMFSIVHDGYQPRPTRSAASECGG